MFDITVEWFGDGREVEVEEAVVGVEDFEVAADGLAAGADEAFPIEAADEGVEVAADGGFLIESEESAGGAVDEGDGAVGVEEEDAFLEGLEDAFEEALLAEEAIDEGLDLPGFEAVEAGDEFLDEAGMHEKFVGKPGSVFSGACEG